MWFLHIISKPTIVLILMKVSLCKLRPYRQPSISDIVCVTKKLNFLPTQTKSLNHVINFLRLLQRANLRFLCNNNINVNIWMDEAVTWSFLRLSLVSHQTMLFYSYKDSFVALGWILLSEVICFNPHDIFTSFVAPCFHQLPGIL